MKKEIEAAFPSIDKDSMRKQLKESGFEMEIPEYMMQRKAFDFPVVPVGHSKWARVRKESGKITMTIKDIYGPGINDIFETELQINDFETGVEFLKSCGLIEKAFQESLRETWRRGEVEAVIDTWPGINPFLEIEGSDEETVRAASAELGLDFSKAVFGPVGNIYERELGIPEKVVNQMPEITFANPPKGQVST